MIWICHTNETLPAIIAGLDIKPDDRIISICGSGDQPLAIAQYASSVLAVDINQDSLQSAEHRASLLKKGRFKRFLLGDRIREWYQMPYFLVNPEKEIKNGFTFDRELIDAFNYFNVRGRLESIRKKINSVSFVGADIFNTSSLRVAERPFDKAYLSNALEFNFNIYTIGGVISICDTIKQRVDALRNMVEPGGIVYLTQNGATRFYTDDTEKAMSCYFDKEPALTAAAQQLEHKLDWFPVVYRRVR